MLPVLCVTGSNDGEEAYARFHGDHTHLLWCLQAEILTLLNEEYGFEYEQETPWHAVFAEGPQTPRHPAATAQASPVQHKSMADFLANADLADSDSSDSSFRCVTKPQYIVFNFVSKSRVSPARIGTCLSNAGAASGGQRMNDTEELPSSGPQIHNSVLRREEQSNDEDDAVSSQGHSEASLSDSSSSEAEDMGYSPLLLENSAS